MKSEGFPKDYECCEPLTTKEKLIHLLGFSITIGATVETMRGQLARIIREMAVEE